LSHSIDGIDPSSVKNPTSLQELSSFLEHANSSGLSVVPWGGGTRIGVGNIPAGYDVALDMTGHTAHLEHVAGDMTVVVDSGVRIADLSVVLKKQEQRLPFEVRDAERATVGGSVASNAPGRRQSSTGGIRDWVIGMQIVLADGTVTKSGGRVVKNVQGYDMHRLHTGAFGTLGVISQVAFKLVPLPVDHQTIIAWFEDEESAQEVGVKLVNGLISPEVISLVSGSLGSAVITAAGESPNSHESWTLVVRLGGGMRSVKRQVSEVTGAVGAGGAAGYAILDKTQDAICWTTLAEFEENTDLSVRVTTRTKNALDISHQILNNSKTHTGSIGCLSAICDLGFGAMTVLVKEINDEKALSLVSHISSLVTQKGGSFVVEKCSLAVKKQIDVFSDVGSSLAVMLRVKAQFDPTNTLNPGRFVGKI